MGQQDRAALYNALKAHGWEPEKRYAQYGQEELHGIALERGLDPGEIIAEAIGAKEAYEAQQHRPASGAPRANAPDPGELPGQRQNLDPEVIRVDDEGREWYQEEVRKPSYPKPRGRRVLTYMDTGVKTETIKVGEYMETFEVAGEQPSRPSEVKITMPSYQVGIYKDPRFPFKIHTYNDREGFDLFDVHNFFGGSELVPWGVKRTYIENSLCYDIRSVVQAIQSEYRQLQLQGKA